MASTRQGNTAGNIPGWPQETSALERKGNVVRGDIRQHAAEVTRRQTEGFQGDSKATPSSNGVKGGRLRRRLACSYVMPPGQKKREL